MKTDVLALSLESRHPLRGLLKPKPEYGQLVTFLQNKKLPVYNWFYYKEGFGRDLVWNLLDELSVPKDACVLDQFAGTGTTLLACQQRGVSAVGFDVSPLALFASKVKLQTNYDPTILRKTITEVTSKRFGETTLTWPDIKFISPKKAFNRYARNDLLFFKEKIMAVEDERIRDFLLLGLIAVTIKASNIKRDGGVLKIKQKKHPIPVKHLLKRRLVRMFKDLKDFTRGDCDCEVRAGDARSLDLEDESVGACINSPPYLNFIDYAKLYAFENALLSGATPKEVSSKTLRSHVFGELGSLGETKNDYVRELVEHLADASDERTLLAVGGYFNDMTEVLSETFRVLKPGGVACFVVGNTVFPTAHIEVDLILADIAREIGFRPQAVWAAHARWANIEGVDRQPVRESIIVLRK